MVLNVVHTLELVIFCGLLQWNFALMQISPGITESVQTSTITIAQPTSSTPTFTTPSSSIVIPISEIQTFEMGMTVESFNVNGQVIDASNSDIFDPTTSTYAEARNGIVAYLTSVYQNDPTLGPVFIGIIFIRFRQGSIIAEFKAQFKDSPAVSDVTTKDGLSQVIATNNVVQTSNTMNITLVPNSVTIGDFNECANATSNNCHADAECINSLGSFRCVCKSGTTGNGISCVENETDRTVLYIMIAVVSVLVLIIIIFIVFTCSRRKTAKANMQPLPQYPEFDYNPTASTPQLKGLPRARPIVLPPSTPSERYRFYYRNNDGWDADY